LKVEEVKMNKTLPHPDDHMTVSITLAFQAKLNPDIDEPPPLFATEIEQTFAAADAVDFLEQVICAIRERRLFGFTLQEQAESAVGSGGWIEKSPAEVIASGGRLPNVQKITVRVED
jgi:hypothetical protein